MPIVYARNVPKERLSRFFVVNVGAIPKACGGQVLRVFPVDHLDEIRVCCSGSFRIEQTLAQACNARLIGNDVSLLTCAIGILAAKQQPFDLAFKNRLAFVDRLTEGQLFCRKVAAVMVASEMSRFLGPSERDAAHRRHYETEFERYLDNAEKKLCTLVDSLRLDGFGICDFRDHASEASGRNSAVIGFPPTYKGGYERKYRFLDENIEWPRPVYSVWDPKQLASWLESLAAAGISYCVGTDHIFDGVKPVAAHIGASRKAIYLYANVAHSSLVRESIRTRQFKYEVVDPDGLRQDSEVLLVPVGAQEISFLKDRYLAKGIAHTTGAINILVYLDGKLAGGFIYTRAKHDPARTLYLLCDFSTSRERRLSKLISLLATCETPVSLAERRMLIRVDSIITTAFTSKPVSMKYRGAFTLIKRCEGFLQYASKVRRRSYQDIYREWFKKHASAGNRE